MVLPETSAFASEPGTDNPDLPHRLARGAVLNEANPDTFYTPGPVGYTDYPALGDRGSGPNSLRGRMEIFYKQRELVSANARTLGGAACRPDGGING